MLYRANLARKCAEELYQLVHGLGSTTRREYMDNVSPCSPHFRHLRLCAQARGTAAEERRERRRGADARARDAGVHVLNALLDHDGRSALCGARTAAVFVVEAIPPLPLCTAGLLLKEMHHLISRGVATIVTGEDGVGTRGHGGGVFRSQEPQSVQSDTTAAVGCRTLHVADAGVAPSNLATASIPLVEALTYPAQCSGASSPSQVGR
jgi:hypothetical protein